MSVVGALDVGGGSVLSSAALNGAFLALERAEAGGLMGPTQALRRAPSRAKHAGGGKFGATVRAINTA